MIFLGPGTAKVRFAGGRAGKEQRFAAWFTKLQILLHKCVSRFLKSALSQRALRYALRPSAPDSDSHDTGAGRGAASWALGHHKAPSCCWSGGPQPEGNRIRQRASRPCDVLSHPLSCMSCRVPAKVYNRAPSIAAAGVESGCALRGES